MNQTCALPRSAPMSFRWIVRRLSRGVDPLIRMIYVVLCAAVSCHTHEKTDDCTIGGLIHIMYIHTANTHTVCAIYDVHHGPERSKIVFVLIRAFLGGGYTP